ncbi:MAG: LLM class flavin-dependent oxidoreductase, partial [Acidimicrobiia bacterium]|nr:LLM class flavin-dependent oxidoreductase [Acidimicrobiia bacterium]
MELGVTTFAETIPAADGTPVDHGTRLRQVVEEAQLADEVGLDVYGVGEHHRPDFASSAPAVVLATIAGVTDRIRLCPAVSVLSSDDPVRVYQQYATLDLLSGGRAELLVGRGSFTESFPLFGYSLNDYDDLFTEKLDLLMRIRDHEHVTWEGRFRPALTGQGVYPRALQDPLPIWLAVGGTLESAIRAGTLGIPMTLAIIGGRPGRFATFSDLHRQALEAAGHDPTTVRRAVHAHGFIGADGDAAADQYFPPY